MAAAHLAVATAAFAAFCASDASAALYAVRPCTMSATAYAGSGLLLGDGATVNDQCATGGGDRMSFPNSAVYAGQGNAFRVLIPAKFPNARIRQLSGNVTIAARSGSGGAPYTIDETNGGYNPNGQPQLTFAAGAQIGPRDFFQAPVALTRSIIWRLFSDGTTTYDASALGAHFVLNGINADIDDSTQPLMQTFARTELLDGTPQAGKRVLTLSAKDEDSGVHDVLIRSGALQFANLGDGAKCTYIGVQACPGERVADLMIDTTQLADGRQSLTITTLDAANNTQVTQTPTFTVANAAAPTPTPLPPNGNSEGQAIVTIGLKAVAPPKRPSAVSTSRNRPVMLRGRLLAADASPMAGATLDITHLPRFEGHVDATPIPTGGIRVAIQYHLANGGWGNADVITTGPTGDFTWKHRFRTAGN